MSIRRLILLASVIIWFGVLMGCGSKGENNEIAGPPGSPPAEPATMPFSGDKITRTAPSGTGVVSLDNGVKVEAATRQMLLTFRQDVNREAILKASRAIEKMGGKIVGENPPAKMLQIETPTDADIVSFIDVLNGLPDVLVATPNSVVTLSAINPNPDTSSSTFPPPNSGYWVDAINARRAWDLTTGNTNIVIGIVDTGINLDSGHFDTKREWISILNPLELPSISDQVGCFRAPIDRCMMGHGTFVSSLAGSDGADGRGSVGVAWQSPLTVADMFQIVDSTDPVSAKVFQFDLTQAIVQTIMAGARVINVSWGMNCSAEEKRSGICTDAFLNGRYEAFREGMSAAVSYARETNTLLVFAAGNEELKNQDRLLPVGAEDKVGLWKSNAVIVAATNANDATADFSNTGAVIDIAAPGKNVAGADAGKTNASLLVSSGTSFAAPIITGSAALVFGLSETFLPSEVKEILKETARPIIVPDELTGKVEKVGAGIVDTFQAVERANVLAEIPLAVQIDLTLSKGETRTIDIPVTTDPRVLKILDVLFLIDTSGSFGDDIATLKAVANKLISDLSVRADDVQFGVARFADFPIFPYGATDSFCDDHAFKLEQPVTADRSAVFSAIDRLDQPLNCGEDDPESQLEALYQAATGQGRDLNGDGDFDDLGDIKPANIGFRRGALPIVVLSTDATFHDSAAEPAYPGEARVSVIEALREKGIIVIGLDSGDTGADLKNIVDATGGRMFALSSDSSGMADAILTGVTEQTSKATLSLKILNDAEGFVERDLNGDGDFDDDGESGIDPVGFPDVGPGETRTFRVMFTGAVKSGIRTRSFPLRIEVRSKGVAVLKRIPVVITVPAEAAP